MWLGMIAFAAQAAADPIPSFLVGGWVMDSPNGAWTEEWWTPPRADLMIGAGRSGKGNTIGWWEHMRIERADGRLRFCALPKGQAGACFMAIKATANEIIFENLAHDFPNRIAYRRDGNELFAEISGQGSARPQRFRFRRIN